MAEKWTPKMVADRMEEAAKTLRRLPGQTIQGCRAFWPDIIHEFSEAYGWDKPVARLGSPPPDAITRMDECLDWLRWLEPDATRLIWLRAEGTPWKLIMKRFGIARSTASSRWSAAIMQIVAILNIQKRKMSGHLCTRQVGQSLL
ncbi:MAG: hypothetical protein HQL74_08180 [Magnetococcales bacterium]|nr:hypothetical protein [Magnetococcales bacterium]